MHQSVRSLAIAVLGFLTLAACAGSPAASVGPSASISSSRGASETPMPRPSVEPSRSPTASPSPLPEPSRSPAPDPAEPPETSPQPVLAAPAIEPTHAAGIEPGLLAKTITSNLRIRSKPGLGDDSAKLEPLLEKGNRFMVLDGPVEADGYDWFLVAPRAYDENNRVLPTGWVAAGKDGEQWIKPLELDCPSVPTDVDDMKDLASDYQLSCFSGVEITFSARLEQTGYPCSSPMPIEPAWFGRCPTEFSLSLVALNSFHRFLGNTWGPDLDLSIAARPAAPPEMWPTVEVTGQFDHPAARTCLSDAADEIQQAKAVLACRNAFVVTSLRVIEE